MRFLQTGCSAVNNGSSTAGQVPVLGGGNHVLKDRTELASTQVSLVFARQKELITRLGNSARLRSLQASNLQQSFLVAALFADSPELFLDYARWAKVALTHRGWDAADLSTNLECLCDALRFELETESAEVPIGIVQAAIEQLPSFPEDIPRFIKRGEPYALLAKLYLEALDRADLRAARTLILGAVKDGIPVDSIYLHVLQPVLFEIGRLWQTNQISVAREHFCTAATRSILSLVQQQCVSDKKQTAGTVVATSVAGEQHEIGIAMVADFFAWAGWGCYFLGADTPTNDVISELIERDADVLAVSLTMANHVPDLAGLIKAVRETSACKRVKILVGGHPFSLDADLWSVVGADGQASEPNHAIDTAQVWLDS